MDYEFTVEDPATFSDRFAGIVPMTKVGGLLYEYACHEGNYGMVNILEVPECRSGWMRRARSPYSEEFRQIGCTRPE